MFREPYKTLKFNLVRLPVLAATLPTIPAGVLSTRHNHFNQAGSPTEGKQTKIQINNDSSVRNLAMGPPQNPPKYPCWGLKPPEGNAGTYARAKSLTDEKKSKPSGHCTSAGWEV